MSISVNGKTVFAGLGYGGSPMLRGMNMIAIDDGKLLSRSTFDFYSDNQASSKFAEAVKALPDEALIVIAVADTVGGGGAYTDEALAAIRSLGATKGPYTNVHAAYILIGQKGLKSGTGIEVFDAKPGGPGPIRYPKAGPASRKRPGK